MAQHLGGRRSRDGSSGTAVTARRTPFDNVAGRAVGRVKVATLAFVCLSAAAATTIFIAGRGLIFFYHEWSFVLYRRDNDRTRRDTNSSPAIAALFAWPLPYEVPGKPRYQLPPDGRLTPTRTAC